MSPTTEVDNRSKTGFKLHLVLLKMQPSKFQTKAEFIRGVRSDLSSIQSNQNPESNLWRE